MPKLDKRQLAALRRRAKYIRRLAAESVQLVYREVGCSALTESGTKGLQHAIHLLAERAMNHAASMERCKLTALRRSANTFVIDLMALEGKELEQAMFRFCESAELPLETWADLAAHFGSDQEAQNKEPSL